MPQLIRTAILIGSDYQNIAGRELPGSMEDLQNIGWFLSRYGGFLEEEIIWLENPRRDEITDLLDNVAPCDFLLVYYSGHGFLQNGRTHLLLADEQNLPVSDLDRPVSRQLNILDCCRNNDSCYPPNTSPSQRSSWDVAPPENDFTLSRELLDELITKSDNGKINIYSCSPGEFAFSGSRLGSRFTFALTLTAVAALANANTPVNLFISDVFLDAKQWVILDSAKNQHPTGRFGQFNQLDFPFAVLA